ncbi:MAG: uracil-DNA glycosylase [Alphaproteobacteria bacterium]|nr:uracil-DNA glycosylase [Alphaproteobacteria bacterium]
MRLPQSWAAALGGDPLGGADFDGLRAFLAAEEAEHTVLPPAEERFAAFEHTPFDAVRVVLLGQDPYHGNGQAHGLSFSVKKPRKPPPSLKNIFQELADDVGFTRPDHGELTAWADRGVLLLNAVLTVRHKKAGSHRKKGWEPFTDAVIDALSAREAPLAFLLWGKAAQEKAERIAERHLVLTAPHPSPYSAETGFFGCKHFSQVNTWLVEQGQAPIDWSLD